MAPVSPPDATDDRNISPGIFAAIGISAGAIVFLLVWLTFRLVRATGAHKRLLADLEEQGIDLNRVAARGVGCSNVTRPRGVLRRHTFLPHSFSPVWGSLSSREDIVRPRLEKQKARSQLSHVEGQHDSETPARPWILSKVPTIRGSLKVKKVRPPHLSAIIESPKAAVRSSAPATPAVNEVQPTSGEKGDTMPWPRSRQFMTPVRFNCNDAKPSVTKELRPHPLSTGGKVTKTARSPFSSRPKRTKTASSASVPTSTTFRASQSSLKDHTRMHGRSVSLCSQSSGIAPTAPAPPLPLATMSTDMVGRSKSMIDRSPSRHSASSFESAGSSILANISPTTYRGNVFQLKKGAHHDWKSSLIPGPRPLRDTFSLRDQPCPKPSHEPITSAAAHHSPNSPPSQRQKRSAGQHSDGSSSKSLSGLRTRASDAAQFRRGTTYSPARNSAAFQASSTPRRRPRSFVTPSGSPTQHVRAHILRDVSGNLATPPTRQLSQTSTNPSSTRSSNGNPFQWDPAPLQSGKPPSAMKGSPSARKGHRRQNCVRISLAPTILGPPSRSSCSSLMKDIQEESPTQSSFSATQSPTTRGNGGLGFASTRALPRPPSSSSFSPALKVTPTTLRASLTPTSPCLSLANYYQDVMNALPKTDSVCSLSAPRLRRIEKRISDESVFSLPSFPSPGKSSGPTASMNPLPPVSRESSIEGQDEHSEEVKFTKNGRTSKVDDEQIETLRRRDLGIDDSPTTGRYGVLSLDPDEQIPDTSGMSSPVDTCGNMKEFARNPPSSTDRSAPFATRGDQTASSNKRARHQSGRDSVNLQSPPCSPKTMRPPSWSLGATSKPERSGSPNRPPETFDPPRNRSPPISPLTLNPVSPSRSSLLTEPLKTPAIAPTADVLPLLQTTSLNRKTKHHSRSKSIAFTPNPAAIPPTTLSAQTLLPSPQRRPAYAGRLVASANGSPTRPSTVHGARVQPPPDIRKAIMSLRRMNSETTDGPNTRAQRRYLRLGTREPSLTLAAADSWTSFLVGDDAAPAIQEGRVWELRSDEVDGDADDDGFVWENDEDECGNAAEDEEREESQAQAGAPDPTRRQRRTTVSSRTDAASATAARHSKRSSVWDEGERFWSSETPPATSPPRTPVKSTTTTSSTPLLATGKGSRADNVATAKRVSMLRLAEAGSGSTPPAGTPGGVVGEVRVEVVPPSAEGTPKSLYDGAGFLRS